MAHTINQLILKWLNSNINKIDSINNNIYLLGDFNFNFVLHYLAKKRKCQIAKRSKWFGKSAMNFVLF